ncbi:MAG: hypothetical protein ACI9V1_000488, partial [Spirosomataceae bacterium]
RTVSIPGEATIIDEVRNAFLYAWRFPVPLS